MLPTHTFDAGVALASVGILLSANRFIRLFLNGPAGVAYAALPRRRLFVPALFLGAASSAVYALTTGFWPLLMGRLLWGLSWAGIWVGGNTIVLDISDPESRGRLIGLYQVSFYLGAGSGALLGGVLTDLVGYHNAMGIASFLAFSGAVAALVFLPETRKLQVERLKPISGAGHTDAPSPSGSRLELGAATALQAVNRLALPGLLSSTFGLLLLSRFGAMIEIAGRSVGVATVTGLALGSMTFISMAASPFIGTLADKTSARWRVIGAGLAPGVLGFLLLALGSPTGIILGLPLTAVAGASNQGLSTVVVGDLGIAGRHSRQLGLMFTAGDFASAVGPPLAYALLPSIDIAGVYLLGAALFAAMLLAATAFAMQNESRESSRKAA